MSRILLAFLLVFFSSLTGQAQTYDATNGVGRGYVGSDRWFAEMRRSAMNQAVLRRVAGTADHRRLPADYVEFAGRIIFLGGNPFPGKRIPDLRIVCRDKGSDDVERSPFVGRDGDFYTVLKRGETYDLYWVYYFGSREKLISITIRSAGPSKRMLELPYRPEAKSNEADERKSDLPQAANSNNKEEDSGLLGDVDEYDLSGFPPQPTNFEEQRVLEYIRSSKSPGTKAEAHEFLAEYYQKRGDHRRARSERAKAKYWSNR